MKYLLDTNVFREIGKTSPHKNLETWLIGVDDAELAISALTVREVAKGIALLKGTKPAVAKEIERRVQSVFDAFEGRTLPVDRAVAQVWGTMLGDSGKHADDAAFAATACVHGLVLVTRNVQDFKARGVPVLNPYKFPPERAS